MRRTSIATARHTAATRAASVFTAAPAVSVPPTAAAATPAAVTAGAGATRRWSCTCALSLPGGTPGTPPLWRREWQVQGIFANSFSVFKSTIAAKRNANGTCFRTISFSFR